MTELVLLLAAVLIHELGHIAAARLFGIPLVSFGIKTVGLSLAFDFSEAGYLCEAAVHSGGAAAGIISALLAVCLPLSFAKIYAGASLALALVNLLPIRSFDGGAILAAVLSEFFLPDTVWRITKAVSSLTVLLLWTAVLWIEMRVTANPGLLAFVCAVLVWEAED